MAYADEITLWRAPSQSCFDPALEVSEGFRADYYPGMGVFVATMRSVAEEFQRCYANGMQELHMSRGLFDSLVMQDIVRPDPYFSHGQSWHVPPAGLEAFNEAICNGSPNLYHPEVAG